MSGLCEASQSHAPNWVATTAKALESSSRKNLYNDENNKLHQTKMRIYLPFKSVALCFRAQLSIANKKNQLLLPNSQFPRSPDRSDVRSSAHLLEQ